MQPLLYGAQSQDDELDHQHDADPSIDFPSIDFDIYQTDGVCQPIDDDSSRYNHQFDGTNEYLRVNMFENPLNYNIDWFVTFLRINFKN